MHITHTQRTHSEFGQVNHQLVAAADNGNVIELLMSELSFLACSWSCRNSARTQKCIRKSDGHTNKQEKKWKNVYYHNVFLVKSTTSNILCSILIHQRAGTQTHRATFTHLIRRILFDKFSLFNFAVAAFVISFCVCTFPFISTIIIIIYR